MVEYLELGRECYGLHSEMSLAGVKADKGSYIETTQSLK
jgi:hypothetical protein